MVGRRVQNTIVTGASVTLAVALALIPSHALAQSTLTTVSPLPQRQAEPQRRVPVPIPADDEDAPAPPSQPVTPATDDGVPAEPGSEPLDGDDPATAEQRANRDGQPLVGVERQQQEDGTLPVGEPPAPRDGIPDTDRDPRLKADIDAFEKPAAGYDAVAFQIDEVDPVLDRRPARLARFEPYDPIGIKRGTWIIFPEIEFGLGATSNVRRSPSADASTLLDVRPTVRAVTNWNQHAIELKATGFASAYPGFATENDKAYALEARGRYDFSKRTTVEFLFSHQLDQEARSAANALDTARDRTNFVTNRAAIAANHRFNRLTVQLRGSVTDVDYAAVTTITGGSVSNDERDRTEFATGARATWEFKPTLFAFTDVALNDRRYRTTPVDSISRDSHGLRVLTGLSFGSSGKTLRGEVGIGWGTQRAQDARLSSVSGMIVDANLGLRVSELTSLLFTARTDFNDSTTLGQRGSRVDTFGVEARHAFRRHLIGLASLRATTTDYHGLAATERDLTAELGFDYHLNRTTTLTGRYTHTDLSTSAEVGGYTVDTVRFGVRIRQ